MPRNGRACWKAENSEPPALLYEDLGPVEKALRDLVRNETASITIDGDAALAAARGFARDHLPAMADKIAAPDAGEILFDRYDINGQIEIALSNRVNLPSGGWLMIETTEAMTTIDVNSGSDEKNARGVNLEAASMIGQPNAPARAGRTYRH